MEALGHTVEPLLAGGIVRGRTHLALRVDDDWHADVGFGLGAHPHSTFVTKLIVAIHRPDGTRVSVSDRESLQRTEQTPSARTTTPLAPEDLPHVLERDFGITFPSALSPH